MVTPLWAHRFNVALFVLKQHWLPNRRLSTRTVRNRLKSVVLKSMRVIKLPLLADRHRRSRFAWCLVRRALNLRTWRMIHWSDHNWFLFHATEGRMRVWRHTNTAYAPRNIQPTVPYGGGSVMVWGVFLILNDEAWRCHPYTHTL
jgi:hypothetical protein